MRAGSALDGLRETLRHSQEMGQGAISIMLKADIEAVASKITDYEELLTMLSEVAGAPIPPADPMSWDTLEMMEWCRSLPNTADLPTLGRAEAKPKET